ncbi:MAG: sulfurtransferase TusA family protein [Rhodospirillales bacterium]
MNDVSAPPPPRVDAVLDITAQTCPMTYVRTRLALDRLAPGQVLEVWLRGAEPARNVPATATQQGHAVLSQELREDGVTVLRLRRG